MGRRRNLIRARAPRTAQVAFPALDGARTVALRATRLAKRAAGLPVRRFVSVDFYTRAVVCHRLRLLYHAIPKTGCTTFQNALLAWDGIEPRPPVAAQCTRLRRNPYLWQTEARWYRGWRRFAFVRNPWDRLLSLWADKVLVQSSPSQGASKRLVTTPYYLHPRFLGMEFPEFARFVCAHDDDEDLHFIPQHYFLGGMKMDFLGRFEDFAESCARLARAFELPQACAELLAGRRNVSQHGHYREYYDDATRRLVERKYARDIALFDYRF